MTAAPRRFVIYAQGRTGSHLLMHLLAAHPQVQCDGEVLNRDRWPGAWQYARRLALRCPDLYLPWRARDSQAPSWGCKVPIATSPRGLGRLAASDWCVLFLQRRSRFDRALSWCVASLTGEFQRSGAERPAHVTVPEALFREQLAFRLHWDERSTRIMAGIPHVPVCYEDDLVTAERRAVTAERLQTTLRLPIVPVRAETRPSFDRRYEDVVTNYAVLRGLHETFEAALPERRRA